MRWNSSFFKCLSVSLVLVMASCKNDPNQTKLTYMPDMADAPTVKPQQDYLDPPNGSVAQNAPLYPPEDQVEIWEKTLSNPYYQVSKKSQEIAREEGAVLYETNCSPCHGKTGKGDGTVTDKYPPPPDLTNELYAERRDGFFFHKITVGGPIMPSRGAETYTHERWKIILHLRTLHKAGSAQSQEQGGSDESEEESQ
ncbi:MAG: c-type cytochrome [Oligoflexales bacterium]|nr:c-type cytochrome [Oligoflexales bacterium]